MSQIKTITDNVITAYENMDADRLTVLNSVSQGDWILCLNRNRDELKIVRVNQVEILGGSDYEYEMNIYGSGIIIKSIDEISNVQTFYKPSQWPPVPNSIRVSSTEMKENIEIKNILQLDSVAFGEDISELYVISSTDIETINPSTGTSDAVDDLCDFINHCYYYNTGYFTT